MANSGDREAGGGEKPSVPFPGADKSRTRRPTVMGVAGPAVLPANRPSARPALVVPSINGPSAEDNTPALIPPEGLEERELAPAELLPEPTPALNLAAPPSPPPRPGPPPPPSHRPPTSAAAASPPPPAAAAIPLPSAAPIPPPPAGLTAGVAPSPAPASAPPPPSSSRPAEPEAMLPNAASAEPPLGERDTQFADAEQTADPPLSAPTHAAPQLPPPPRALESDRAVPSLAQVVQSPVRLLGTELPLYLPLAGLGLLLAVASLAFGALIGGGTAAPSQPQEKLDETKRVEPLPNAKQGSVEPSKLERVAAGEASSVNELLKQAPWDRNAAEAFALASGRIAQQRLKLEAFGQTLPKNAAPNAAAIRELKSYASNADTTLEAMRLIATLEHGFAADMFYELWVGTPGRTTGSELAHDLVYAKEIRAGASPALSVALDLRNAETCPQFKELLPRASQAGDRRAFVVLARLTKKSGCGPKRKDDCFECLREGDGLKDALAETKKRAPPRL